MLDSFILLLAMAVAVFTGCATRPATPRFVFSNMSIEGQPVHMVLDTGAGSTCLYSPATERLGLIYIQPRQGTVAGEFEMVAGMSDPVRLSSANGSSKLRLPVLTLPESARAEDGLIGWPEVRDNILVFDSASRTVRSTRTLPPETSGWMKLKIYRHNTFFLEASTPGGAPGIILVDTGAPQGVQLPLSAWQDCHTAHPELPVTPTTHSTWSAGSFTTQVISPPFISVGQIPFREVPVENMPDSEVDWIKRAVPGAETLGVIGLRALDQLELIVDGKSGFAYLRPTTSSAVRHSKSGNWRVADNVQLNCENLFVRSGNEYCRNGNFASAIAEYSRAIELDPNDPEAYADRGLTRQIHGDFSGALADYDKLIDLIPDDSTAARLHRLTLLRRLGREPGDFSTTVAALKDQWTKNIGLFLAQQIDEKTLLASIDQADEALALRQNCEAFYYIGLMHLFSGDKTGARRYFQKSVATGVREYSEYQFATAELARLTR